MGWDGMGWEGDELLKRNIHSFGYKSSEQTTT